MNAATLPALDAIDLALVRATQRGLPLVPRPWHLLGEQLGIPATEVLRRMQAMLNHGVIRRIGAVPNHYAIGYAANGMSVWDVDDQQVDKLGAQVGALDFVTHCYRRLRHPPHWRHNLFAMVHGSSREEVRAKVAIIRALLGTACHASDVLFSTRILKKTGLRL
jgi:DNA-binding Lrp family transcriptional regulator